jgi:methylenetetrahydrofolate dehydrogenase (NADP+)/methenyltetrahydrofolate cyclohydrolase
MAQIIDGKAIAANVRQTISQKIAGFKDKPGLAVILVGEDPASKVYVGLKEKDSLEIGFYSEVHRLPENASQDEVLSLINSLNENEKIHGLLVQLPLPKHLNTDIIINTISPLKDVDGITYFNSGKLFSGRPFFIPCTPKGVMMLIESTGEKVEGKNAVVIGRSNIVGKPMAMLLMQKNATVTVCHSKTKNLDQIAAQADILVAAIGKYKFVKENMVKKGAIVIDVGTNKDENGKLKGDVDFDAVKEKVSFITPVPGGVGPMTRAMLMQNTYEAYIYQKGLQKA